MCGIFECIGKRTRAQSIDLAIAIKSLHHRGPDDDEIYLCVPKSDPDVACAFDHTRLSIIDLFAGGHQPITTADGRSTIVYNGEVYNFRELRRDLEADGERVNFDTEVVLEANAAWGRRAVGRFRGVCAFAVWGAKERALLFFARDRFGG